MDAATDDLERLVATIEREVDVLSIEMVVSLDQETPLLRLLQPEQADEFRRTMRDEVLAGVDRVRSRTRLLPLATRALCRRLGEQFAGQGIALEHLTRSFDISTRVVVARAVDAAVQLGEGGLDALGTFLRLTMDNMTSAVAIASRAYLERAKRLEDARRRLRDDLVADLITGASASSSSRALALGLPLADVYGVVVVPLPPGTDPVELERTMADVSPHWWAIVGNALTVVTFGSRDEQGRSLGAAEQVANILQPVLGADLVVALGAMHTGLAGIRQSFVEATRVAAAAGASGLRGVVSERDVLLTRLLLEAQEGRAELDRLIVPLESHDADTDAHLVDTVREYIDANLSAGVAAERLGVHRNTVRLRLATAERLLGTPIAELKLPLRLALLGRELQPSDDA